MGSADDHRHTAPAKFPGQRVGMRRGGCVGGDADEVRGFVEVDTLDNFVGVAGRPNAAGSRRRAGAW